MKFHYYPETDSLYIDLADRTSKDSIEVAPGVVVDFDAAGTLWHHRVFPRSGECNAHRLEAAYRLQIESAHRTLIFERKHSSIFL